MVAPWGAAGSQGMHAVNCAGPRPVTAAGASTAAAAAADTAASMLDAPPISAMGGGLEQGPLAPLVNSALLTAVERARTVHLLRDSHLQ